MTYGIVLHVLWKFAGILGLIALISETNVSDQNRQQQKSNGIVLHVF